MFWKMHLPNLNLYSMLLLKQSFNLLWSSINSRFSSQIMQDILKVINFIIKIFLENNNLYIKRMGGINQIINIIPWIILDSTGNLVQIPSIHFHWIQFNKNFHKIHPRIWSRSAGSDRDSDPPKRRTTHSKWRFGHRNTRDNSRSLPFGRAETRLCMRSTS